MIKENEILKYYIIDYEDPQLMTLTKSMYNKLNLKSENEFNNYLKEFNLDIKEIIRKLAIESTWNKLIVQKYNNLLSIDEEKLRNALNNNLNKSKIQTSFLISEILFDAQDETSFKNTYKDITKTIKEDGFETAASIFSISNSSINNGLIGWVNKNELSDLIYNKLRDLKINEFTKPIKVGSGFLIIYLNELKEEEIQFDKEEELKRAINAEKNRQLSQYSTIYYKKIEKKSFINEK